MLKLFGDKWGRDPSCLYWVRFFSVSVLTGFSLNSCEYKIDYTPSLDNTTNIAEPLFTERRNSIHKADSATPIVAVFLCPNSFFILLFLLSSSTSFRGFLYRINRPGVVKCPRLMPKLASPAL